MLDLPAATQAKLRDFDLAIKQLRDTYIAPNAFSDNWLAEVNSFRQKITEGASNDDYLLGFQSLLEKLNDPSIILQAPATNVASTDTTTSTFTGVGMLVGLPEPGKERLVVRVVYTGSPADSAGIKPHDSILAIDGRRVRYDERDTILSRVRGPSGSQVKLTLKSPGQPEREVSVRRGPVTPDSHTEASRIPGTNIAYIIPNNTGDETLPIDLARSLRDLASDKEPDGMILDLRIMQGSTFPVIQMLSLFANLNVGMRYTRAGQQKLEVSGKQIGGSQDVPLVILISDQTQGPAVSFAAMLQDLGRARLVGSRTSSLVAEPSALSLPNTGLQLAIPSIEYRGVKGQALHRAGLVPDVDTQLTWEDFTAENDPQLERAIDLLKR